MAKKSTTKSAPADESRVKTSMSLRPSIWREVRVAALRRGISANELLESLAEAYLRKEAR